MIEFTKKQQSYWDKRSKNYSRLTRNHIEKIKKIIKLLELKKGYKVLEVGVGTGVHAKYFIEKSDVKFTGVDISKGMLDEARRFIGKESIKLLVADCESLPFKDNTFDAVFCTATLHHCNKPYLGLKEMIRVLKKGKKFAIVEPNFWFPKNLFDAILIPEERNQKYMRKKYFIEWSRKLKIKDVKIENFLHSLPFPKFLFGFYRWLDDTLKDIPIIKEFSIQLVMSGRK